jgi:HK97 family phage major capsid protein
MPKLNELKPEELVNGLTVEQKKAILVDFQKTNKEDAETIFKSDDITDGLKKELLATVEKKNAELSDTIKVMGTAVDGLKAELLKRQPLEQHKSDAPLTIGEYLQTMAGVELRKHGYDMKFLTAEKINKFTGMKKDALTIQKAAGDGMEEGDFSEGGAFLRPDYAGDLLAHGYESAEMVSFCRGLTTTGNSLIFSAIKDYDESSGYVDGAVIMYWITEKQAITPSMITTEEYKIELNKAAGLSYATSELIEDSPYSIEQNLKASFGRAFAMMTDDAILNGMGGRVPEGILNSPALVSVAIQSGQTLASSAIMAENIMDMWSHMPSGSQRRAIWIVNPDLLTWLPRMNLTNGLSGVPVYLPMNSLANQPYMTLYGRPIIINDCAQALGTKGDIFLADLNEYAILTKSGSGLRYETSIHVEFLYDQMTFRFIYRINGRGLWKTYKTPRRGTTYRTPFVTLDTRT